MNEIDADVTKALFATRENGNERAIVACPTTHGHTTSIGTSTPAVQSSPARASSASVCCPLKNPSRNTVIQFVSSM